MTLAEHALKAVERGWWVIPLWGVTEVSPGAPGILRCTCPKGSRCPSPGKHPHARLVPRGLSQGSDRAEDVQRWWAEAPGANIGIVCGPSGLLVVDFDGPVKASAVGEGELPATYEVRTGKLGGYHLYYTLPSEVEIPPGAGKLSRYVDHRSGRSYVVAAGSRHVSGRRYEVGSDQPVAKAPPWLIEALRRPERVGAGGEDDTFVERHHGQGERNDWLTSVGGYLRSRGVGADGLVGALVALNRAQCRPPLDADEVAKICRSLLGYPPVNNQDGGNIDERRSQRKRRGTSQDLEEASRAGQEI